MSEDASLEETLSNVRRHLNSGLLNQSRPAHILVAVEATLKEQNQAATAVAYYASLQSVLKEAISRESDSLKLGEDGIIPAVLYLLSLVLPHVSHHVVRSHLSSLLELIAPLFPHLNGSAPSLRSQIGVYGALFPALDRNLLTSTLLLRQSYASILQYTLDSRPKVRKKAQEVVLATISSPPPPLITHPYANQTAEAIIGVLEAIASSPGKTDSAQTGIWACSFVRNLAPVWPPSHLDSLLPPLLALPSLSSPYLTSQSYGLLSVLLQSPTLTLPAPNILSSLLQFSPTHHSQAESWLEAVENTMVALGRTSSEDCLTSLEKVWMLVKSWITSDEVAIRLASERALCAIARYCITDSVILDAPSVKKGEAAREATKKGQGGGAETPVETIVADLKDMFHAVTYANAVSSLLSVLSALLSRFRVRIPSETPNGRTAAELFLSELVQHVGTLRVSKGFEYKQQADETLGTAIRVLGPETFLNLLPLNIIPNPENEDRKLEGRAYLLPLLASHISNTRLTHFIDTFIPLSEKLFNLRTQAGAAGKSTEVKVWDVLIDQIWACFKGYCELCTDLPEAFTIQFARLITNLLYTQPSLRNSILLGLRVLVDSTRTLADSSAPPESLASGFGISQADAKKHLTFLGTLAPNMTSVLFNVFSSAALAERGLIGEVIKAWLTVTSQSDVESTCTKLVEMLQNSLRSPAASQQGTVPVSYTSLDLLLILLPHLPTNRSTDLFEKACSPDLLENKDVGIQKRAYRMLASNFEADNVAQAAIIEHLVKRLPETSESVGHGAEKDRIRLLKLIIPLLPDNQLHLIPSLLTEAVLATKEANAKARDATFDLLVVMGVKMSQGGIIRRSMIQGAENNGGEAQADVPATIEEFVTMVAAGLVGTTPHMISATIVAISRILFEFKDRISQKMQTEVLTTIAIFLKSVNREVVKSTLGFVKLAVIVLPVAIVRPQLSDIIPGLLGWSHDHKNHFKMKVQHIFERMGRRFGWDDILRYAGDAESDGHKILQSIRKRKEKAKRKKARSQQDDGEVSDHEPKPQPITGDAFHDVLYGSESEDGDSEADSHAKNMPKSKVKGQGRNARSIPGGTSREGRLAKNELRLRTDNEDPVDLLHAGAATVTSSNRPKRRQPGQEASHFMTEEAGKLIIKEDDAGNHAADPEPMEDDVYLSQMTSVDGFTRGPRGEVIYHKDTKRRRVEEAKAEDAEMVDGELGEVATRRKEKRQRKEPVRLGKEFKAKNAGGDIKRPGQVDPYAYLPLANVGTKKGRKTKYNITGKR